MHPSEVASSEHINKNNTVTISFDKLTYSVKQNIGREV